MKYTVKKVEWFMNTAEKTTLWIINHYISGYAVMLDNKVIEVYPRKRIAEQAAEALNA